MTQTEGYVDAERPDYVWKLGKSIYRLKQSARCWYSTLDQHLVSPGNRKSNADGFIYIKVSASADGQSNFAIFAVYVDDIVSASNDMDMLSKEKLLLCQWFEMTHKGEAHHILGMLITRDRDIKHTFISQQRYLESVLERYGMENCKPISTPLKPVKHCSKLLEDDEAFDKDLLANCDKA